MHGNNQFYFAGSRTKSERRESSGTDDVRHLNADGQLCNQFYGFNRENVVAMSVAPRALVSPNVIQNLEEVEEEGSAIEIPPYAPASPIASRNFDFGEIAHGYSERAKVSPD